VKMERQRVRAITLFCQLRKEKEKIVGDWLE
jgi:hypothetical protein